MTVNLILYVVGYHYNFIQVNSTNFIVHNSYLIGTSAELNFFIKKKDANAKFVDWTLKSNKEEWSSGLWHWS